MMNLVKGKIFWPKSNKGLILPPLVKRMPGRPVKKRKREALERKTGTKVSRVGRVMTCGYCHEKGHNKVSCPRITDFVKVLHYI